MNDSIRTDPDQPYQVETDIQADSHLQPQRAHLQLAIEGMTCQACASRIEKVLNKKPAIYEVSVNFAGETANVDYDPTQTTAIEITEWVNKTGFVANLQTAEALFVQKDEDAVQRLSWRLIALWVCLIPFLVGMVGAVCIGNDCAIWLGLTVL